MESSCLIKLLFSSFIYNALSGWNGFLLPYQILFFLSEIQCPHWLKWNPYALSNSCFLIWNAVLLWLKWNQVALSNLCFLFEIQYYSGWNGIRLPFKIIAFFSEIQCPHWLKWTPVAVKKNPVFLFEIQCLLWLKLNSIALSNSCFLFEIQCLLWLKWNPVALSNSCFLNLKYSVPSGKNGIQLTYPILVFLSEIQLLLWLKWNPVDLSNSYFLLWNTVPTLVEMESSCLIKLSVSYIPLVLSKSYCQCLFRLTNILQIAMEAGFAIYHIACWTI